MATTSVINTTLMGIYVLDTTYKKINHSTDATVEITHSPRDITTKDSAGWRALLEGLRSWTASGSILVAFDATYGIDELFSAIYNRSQLTIRFMTNVVGDTRWTGTGYLSNISISSADAEGNVSASFTIEGTGSLVADAVTT